MCNELSCSIAAHLPLREKKATPYPFIVCSHKDTFTQGLAFTNVGINLPQLLFGTLYLTS